MRILRAGLIGIVLWALIFFEVSILMFGLKLTEGVIYYTIHYILLVLITLLGAFWYFRKPKLRGGFLHGLLVGLVFVITGIILDSILTIPLWIIPQGGSYLGFLLDSYLLIGELIVIVVSGVVGGLRR